MQCVFPKIRSINLTLKSIWSFGQKVEVSMSMTLIIIICIFIIYINHKLQISLLLMEYMYIYIYKNICKNIYIYLLCEQNTHKFSFGNYCTHLSWAEVES